MRSFSGIHYLFRKHLIRIYRWKTKLVLNLFNNIFATADLLKIGRYLWVSLPSVLNFQSKMLSTFSWRAYLWVPFLSPLSLSVPSYRCMKSKEDWKDRRLSRIFLLLWIWYVILYWLMQVHLIEGILDQVNGTVYVSWAQPRVLGIPQIKLLRDQLDSWVDKVHTTLLSVEAETPDLVAA